MNRKEAQLDPKRKPLYDLDLPTVVEAWLFSGNFISRTVFLILQVFLYAFRPMIISPKPLFIEDFIGAITQALYLGSAWIYGGQAAFIYMVAATFLGSGLHVCAIHFVAEHYLITPETSYTNDPNATHDTFSYYGPINYLIYNGGYHVEHHDFPRVSWKNLPRIREIAPEFYDTIPHHTSYVEVMFRFIFNHPGLWQRVKRADKGSQKAN